jgi:alkylhydroperoxidase family enzyme
MDARTKIRVVEDDQATGEVAQVYEEWRAKTGRRMVPGIYKCFSARPDVLRHIMVIADCLHFSEGHLTRRMKEAIATYVSAINHCPY